MSNKLNKLWEISLIIVFAVWLSQPTLADKYEIKPKEIEALRKKAISGDLSAQNTLGKSYHLGAGVKQDYVEAAFWYLKAAEQGDIRAQYNLGVFYATGKGVKQNSVEAVKWHLKAADQGHATAQNNLGVCYEIGMCTEKNEAEAFEWFRKASRQGNDCGQYNLSMHYSRKDVSRWDSSGTEWYSKAAEPLRGFRMGEPSEEPLNKPLGQPSTDDCISLTDEIPEEFWRGRPVEFIEARDPGFVVLKYANGEKIGPDYKGIHWAVLSNWEDEKRKTGKKRMMTLFYTTSRGVEVVDDDTGIRFMLYGPMGHHPIDNAKEVLEREDGSVLGWVTASACSIVIWDAEVERVYEALGGDLNEPLRRAHQAWLAYSEAKINLIGEFYSKMSGSLWRIENANLINSLSRDHACFLQLLESHYVRGMLDEND